VLISTTDVNHTNEFVPYMSSKIESAGLRDIYSMYVPRGPIRKYVTYPRSGGGMPLYVGHSEYYDFDHIMRHILGRPSLETKFKDQVFGGGKGYALSGMAISGIAETFERSVGAFGYFSRADDALMFGSIKSLSSSGATFLSPDELRIFAPEQFADHKLIGDRYAPFTELSEITWVQGKRLFSGAKIMVPAQIGLPFFVAQKAEVRIGYFTSGGLAAHINTKEAIYHGVLELFERDAVNLRWNCRMAPERIVEDGPYENSKLERLLKLSHSLPVELRFYLHRNDFAELPVVTALGFLPSFKRYSYGAGGGVAFNIEESMLYSLLEFGQSEGTMRYLLLAKDWELAKATKKIFHVGEDAVIEDIDHFFKVLTYYGYQKNFNKLDWYLNGNKTVRIDELPRASEGTLETRYAMMEAMLKKHHLDPIVIDLSPSQMPQMKLFKVMIPELSPPYVQNLPMLGSERYYEVPRKLGLADHRLSYSEVFTEPQPYP
jgi:ribosomal protein S12 methylthiotransferase accessory factor